MPDPRGQKLRTAAFLDRDGVLNRDLGYVHRISALYWTDGVVAAIQALNRVVDLIIIVTNQSGVARDYYSLDDVAHLHAHMQSWLAARGADIDAFYVCPHHPTAGNAPFRCVCSCRKPAPGLIEQAIAAHGIDRQQSFLIGDSERDLKAADAAGLAGYLFQGGRLDAFVTDVLRQRARLDAESP